MVDGLNVVQSLPGFFQNGDSETRLKIISSIFNKKIVFDGTNYRTPTFNAILKLLFSNTDD